MTSFCHFSGLVKFLLISKEEANKLDPVYTDMPVSTEFHWLVTARQRLKQPIPFKGGQRFKWIEETETLKILQDEVFFVSEVPQDVTTAIHNYFRSKRGESSTVDAPRDDLVETAGDNRPQGLMISQPICGDAATEPQPQAMMVSQPICDHVPPEPQPPSVEPSNESAVCDDTDVQPRGDNQPQASIESTVLNTNRDDVAAESQPQRDETDVQPQASMVPSVDASFESAVQPRGDSVESTREEKRDVIASVSVETSPGPRAHSAPPRPQFESRPKVPETFTVCRYCSLVYNSSLDNYNTFYECVVGVTISLCGSVFVFVTDVPCVRSGFVNDVLESHPVSIWTSGFAVIASMYVCVCVLFDLPILFSLFQERYLKLNSMKWYETDARIEKLKEQLEIMKNDMEERDEYSNKLFEEVKKLTGQLPKKTEFEDRMNMFEVYMESAVDDRMELVEKKVEDHMELFEKKVDVRMELIEKKMDDRMAEFERRVGSVIGPLCESVGTLVNQIAQLRQMAPLAPPPALLNVPPPSLVQPVSIPVPPPPPQLVQVQSTQPQQGRVGSRRGARTRNVRRDKRQRETTDAAEDSDASLMEESSSEYEPPKKRRKTDDKPTQSTRKKKKSRKTKKNKKGKTKKKSQKTTKGKTTKKAQKPTKKKKRQLAEVEEADEKGLSFSCVAFL